MNNITEQNSLDFSLIEVKDGKVNARGLHEFLEVGKDFSNWIKDLIEKYDFVEGEDFSMELAKTNGRPKNEYLLTVDISKEVSMVTNTVNGKKARRYFIQAEKKLREIVKPKELSKLEVLEIALESEKKRIIAEQEAHKLALENTKLASREIEVKTQKQYKWIKQEIQNDRGRTINYYVNKYFLEGNSYSAAHTKAKEAYKKDTGLSLPSAKFMSQEQKIEYLNWLSKLSDTRIIEVKFND